MPGVVLNIEVIDRSPIKILKREMNRIKKETLAAVAEEFHKERLPAHFGPANRRRFQHEPRNKVYANEIKKRFGTGQGKHVDNILSGRSRRRAMAFAKVTATSKQATLKLTMPAYFTKPFVGTWRDPETGYTRRITRQPDKVRELVTMDAKDKEWSRKRAAFHSRRLIGELAAQREARSTSGLIAERV